VGEVCVCVWVCVHTGSGKLAHTHTHTHMYSIHCSLIPRLFLVEWASAMAINTAM